jgi:hypothetical protein
MLITKCKSPRGILEDEMLAPARHFGRAFHFMKHGMLCIIYYLINK